jgi:quinoprotein dehydrogenase-associated probable ABC transporter substrate-binding protein
MKRHRFTSLLLAGLATPILICGPTLVRAEPAGTGLQSVPAAGKPSDPASGQDDTAHRVLKRDYTKEFDELTPSEKIAIRAIAKKAYEEKKLDSLIVCADPGNMPFSNQKLEGFENKLAELLGKWTGAKVNFYWRPSYERGMTRQTFDVGMCDAMIDIPTSYETLLTTEPIYRTTYVLAYRDDKGIHIKNFDDPQLKKLKIGVYETSGIRQVLLKHGIFDNVSLQTVSHDADINKKHQPWYQVQKVVDGKLDIAAVWGPFAGWVKSKGEPITIQPVNLWEDTVPLEFDLSIGVRKTDVLLKYILDFALNDHKAEIKKLLNEYGFPLVKCSKCVVEGTLPAHGSYTKVVDVKPLPPVPASEEAAKLKALKAQLAAGADPNQELSEAVIADDPVRVKYLVTKGGAEINARDSQGYTPLTSAARQRYTNLIKLLLDLKANPNVADGDNETPLLEAVLRDDVPSIKVLLAHGANMQALGPNGFDPLAFAIEERKYEAAKTLIDAGAKVNVAVGEQRLTPLMIAVAESAPAEGAIFVPSSTRPIDIAKILIDKGADVHAKDKNGMTALMVAASHNNAPMIGLLLQSGADASAKNAQGQTALDIAKLNGNTEAAQAISVLGKMFSATQAPAPASSGGTQEPKG